MPDAGELDQKPAEHALVLLLRVQGRSPSSPRDDPQHPQAHQRGARVPGEQAVQKVPSWRAGGRPQQALAEARLPLHEEAERGHPRQEGLPSKRPGHDDRVPAHLRQREHQRQAWF